MVIFGDPRYTLESGDFEEWGNRGEENMDYFWRGLFWNVVVVGFWGLVIWGAIRLLKKLMGGSASGFKGGEARWRSLEERMDVLEARFHRLEREGPSIVSPEISPVPMAIPDPVSPRETSVRQIFASQPSSRGTEGGEESMESQVAGKWFQWIAIASILFGTGYFLKLAFENNWIGPMGRVMMGWISGVAFLITGHRLIVRFKGYALGLMGGGLGLLYLSTYGAFHFYQIIGNEAAFGLMILTTAAGIGLAVLNQSQVLATLAVAGGFLTPALLSTGVDHQIELMSYLLVLDVGVVVVSLFQKWRIIRYGSWVVTALYCWGRWDQFYRADNLWTTLGFHTVFYLLFAAVAVGYDLLRRTDTDEADGVFSLGNGFFYYASTYALMTGYSLGETYRPFLAMLALVLGGFYGWQASLAIRRREAGHPPFLAMVLLGMGVTFMTIAIPVQFKESWVTVGWAVEAVALMWAGLRANHRGTRMFAMGVLALVMFRLLALDGWVIVTQVVWNKRLLPFVVGLGGIGVTAWLLHRAREQLEVQDRNWAAFLGVLGNFLMMWYLSLEVVDFWNLRGGADLWNAKQVSLSLLWLVYASGMMAVGIGKKIRDLRLLAIVTFSVTILKVFFSDLSVLHGGYRVLSLIGLGVILLGISFVYQRNRDKFAQLIKEEKS